MNKWLMSRTRAIGDGPRHETAEAMDDAVHSEMMLVLDPSEPAFYVREALSKVFGEQNENRSYPRH